MALRLPIVDIPLDDSDFQQFATRFTEYSERLAKTPGIWQRAGKESKIVTAAILAQNQAMREALSAEREQTRHLITAGRLWNGISNTARGVAGSMLSATAHLIKWASVFAGVGSFLGPFALMHMASDVSGERRQAMGFGTSIGGMKSFATNFGRVVSPQAFLGGITEMRTNPEMQGALAALGVSPRGSTMSVAMQVMNALRQQALMTPVDQLGLVLKKYPIQGVSVEDLMRMRGMSNSEWAAQEAHFARDRSSMNIGPKTARAWQDFTTQIERAGGQIFKTFVTGLLPLEKPLEKLSGSFVNVLQALMKKDGIIEQGINAFAGWLDSFNGKISKPQFLTDIEQFTSDVGAMARTFHKWAQAIGDVGSGHPGKAITDLGGQSPRSVGESFGEYLRNLFVIPSDYRRYLAGLDKKYRLPSGTLERMWQTESHGDFNAVNPRTGAAGPFQFMPKTAAMYGLDPFNPGKSADAAGDYVSSLAMRHYHGDISKALAAYNWGEGNVDRMVSRYGAAWRSHLPAETAAYVTKTAPTITIQNATGGSAVVAVNGLAQ